MHPSSLSLPVPRGDWGGTGCGDVAELQRLLPEKAAQLAWAEEALRAQQRRSQALLENSFEVVAFLDAEGVIRYATPASGRALGYTADELTGQDALALLHPEDRADARELFGRLLRDPAEVVTSIPRVRHKDGTYRRMDARGTNRLGEPDVEAVVFNFRDVTGYKPVEGQAEHTDLRRAEEQLRRLSRAVEQSPCAVIITDCTGAIEYVNPKFTEVTGYAAEEVLGRNPRILKSGRHPPSFYQELWGTITAGKEWRGEFCSRRKDGRLYWETASISPIRDAGGAIASFVAVKEDITEKKQLEEQLRQAVKMEAVGRLAGGVAHDFNNLLCIINGYSELLLRGLPPNDPTRGLLQEIRRAGERSASLTRQLLTLSRKQVVVPRVLDVNAVVLDIRKMLRRLIGEDVELRTDLDPSPGNVRADAGQLEQVLLNLTVNARDAMPRGGTLTLQTRNAGGGQGPDGAGTRPGQYVMLAVTDTGCGMADEVQEHLFEPFFTTKGRDQGTGLGLATVYGIVTQAGGHIEVVSAPGRGSTFRIYLPRVEEGLEAVSSAPALAASPQGTETVLLLEDEPAVRALVAHILRGSGYSVLEAAEGEEALRVCRQHGGPIHLLVSDVVLPGGGGPGVAERLLPLHPGLRVLYLSGYADDAVFRHGVVPENGHFLAKPFAAAALARKVREVLDASPAKDVAAGEGAGTESSPLAPIRQPGSGTS